MECPICGDTFDPTKGVKYLDEDYCSAKCAEEAAQEGKTVLPPTEEDKQAG